MSIHCTVPVAGICLFVTSIICAAAVPAGAADVAELARNLQGTSGAGRYEIIDELGACGPAAENVVPQLVALLDNDDPHICWHSARALGRIGSTAKSAAPKLRKLLSSDNAAVRIHSAVALGKVGDSSDATVDVLVKAVTSGDAAFARAAIGALRKLKPNPELVAAALNEVLASDDPGVTIYAVEAVVERGAGAVPVLRAALKQEKAAYWACVAIEEIGADASGAVPELSQLLSTSTDELTTTQALLALASIGPAAAPAAPAIQEALQKSLGSPNQAIKTVPVAAAYALGSIGAKDASGLLATANQSGDPFLTMVSAWALAKIDPHDQTAMSAAVQQLTDGLKSQDSIIRAAAAKGLEQLQAPAELVAPKLVALANDPDPKVVAHVVDALVSLGEQIVPHAARALSRPEMRGLALDVLSRLGPVAKPAVPQLLATLKTADPKTRAQVQHVLGSIGEDAGGATDELVKSLSSDDDAVRHSALYALRYIGPAAESAKPALVELLSTGQPFDKVASAWALVRVSKGDPRTAVLVIPVLLESLRTGDDFVQLETAVALGDLGPAASRVVETLQGIAKSSPNSDVRIAAAAAAERISTTSNSSRE